MIKPVTMYSVVCDRCGKTFIDEFNGIIAWLDEGTAKEQAMEKESYKRLAKIAEEKQAAYGRLPLFRLSPDHTPTTAFCRRT